jgi:hypothetical protein
LTLVPQSVSLNVNGRHVMHRSTTRPCRCSMRYATTSSCTGPASVAALANAAPAPCISRVTRSSSLATPVNATVRKPLRPRDRSGYQDRVPEMHERSHCDYS